MFILLLIVVVTLIFYITSRKLDYWKRKKVPYKKPSLKNILLGNYDQMLKMKKSWPETVQDICKSFPNEPVIGAFLGTEPVLIPVDPEIIKLIMTKDFYYFNARDVDEHTPNESTSLNVFATFGDTWKALRKNLTPLFSSAKMKNMFHFVRDSCLSLESYLNIEIKTSGEVKMKNVSDMLMTDSIGACIFGVKSEELGPNGRLNVLAKTSNKVIYMGRRVMAQRLLFNIWPRVLFFVESKLIDKTLPFILEAVKSVIDARQNNMSNRNNIVDLISSWKHNGYITGDSINSTKTGVDERVKIKVTDNLLAAQCFIFYTAAFESSSNTLCHMLFELAKHEDIQRKVSYEIDEYLSQRNNNLEYDCMHELPYTTAVFDETLRLYPAMGVVTRKVMEEYTLPNGVCLDKGLRVQIPLYHIHRDPKNFPDPEEFRPERFLESEKQNIKPYTYLPFGEGLRTCFGMRFAKMQILAGLVTVLKDFHVELAEGTEPQFKLNPLTFLTTPALPIRLKLTKREG